MDAAKHTTFSTLYRNYLVYMFVGWLPINFFIGMMVGTVGKLNQDIYTGL